MKRAEILGLVQQAITDRPNPGRHKYYIYWKQDHIACEPQYCTPPPEICFGVFHDRDLIIGFNSVQWTLLEMRICTFLTQKGLL